jgi:hypothetical protein
MLWLWNIMWTWQWMWFWNKLLQRLPNVGFWTVGVDKHLLTWCVSFCGHDAV